MLSVVTIEELGSFFLEVFPLELGAERKFVHVEKGRAVIQTKSLPKELRTDGIVSSSAQMSLADISAYAAIFTQLGIVPMAVTSSLNINFLRPCLGAAIEADARIIKCGRSSIVLAVIITEVGSEIAASKAMVTYVMPKA